MSLVIIGSVAFDTIETAFGRREKIIGGSGIYCSLAASYFTSPGIIGVVGRDFPKPFLAFLESRQIDLTGLNIQPGKTFHWEGRYGVDPNVRTTVKTELNVFRDFSPDVPPAQKDAKIVFLANLDPDNHAFILEQFANPTLIAMDTIRFWIENKRDSLMREISRVDILFVNDEEARLLMDDVHLVTAGRKLLDCGPSLVVIKKGEHGALLFHREFMFGTLAHPCEQVIDPTGAGDSFAGGFLGYLDREKKHGRGEFRRASIYGSAMASFAIEDFGVDRFRSLDIEEIEARFRAFKRLVSF